MTHKKDISTFEDIVLLVDRFYARVKDDDLIGPVFTRRIGDNWQPHLDKMYRFWQSILLAQPSYDGNPFMHHVGLGLDKPHFERWLMLFEETLSDHFAGPQATEALKRATQIGQIFLHKLTNVKTSGDRSKRPDN